MRIVFSHKQLQQLMKTFLDQDDRELGKPQRDELLKLWNSNEQKQFLIRLKELPEEVQWKHLKIDCVYWFEVLNAIDSLLEKLYQQGEQKQQIDANGRSQKDGEIVEALLTILKFLKAFLQHSSNSIYFNSLEHIANIFLDYQDVPLLVQEVVAIFIQVSSKRPPKTHAHYQTGVASFTQEMMKIWPKVLALVQNLDFVSDMLINSDKNLAYADNIQSHIGSLQEDQPSEEVKQKIEGLRTIQAVTTSRQVLEDIFVLILKCVNLYLYTGDVQLFEANKGTHKQRARLEQLLPPKKVISEFIRLLKCSFLGKSVHNGVVNIMFFFVILDLNQTFEFIAPNENLYYLEMCNHYEFFNQILHCLAKHHSYDKLKRLQRSGPDSTELAQLLEQEKTLIGENSEETLFNVEKTEEICFQKTEALESQKFLYNFLIFLCHLLNIKNKNLQNFMFPQLLKPLLSIVSVHPINKIYPLNINVQVKAAKLLKDVVKHASLEDPCAVEVMIKRVKKEIKLLPEDMSDWIKAADDDTGSSILLPLRQEFIKTCLRFLCYSVIREDPNAVSFNQNFIANSRKILESEIIQDELLNYVFQKNVTEGETTIKQIIEPVILQAVQLISYVFNDLPQKITQFLENGVLPAIVNSLQKRIPIQPDMIILIAKFLQTLCLNPEGRELVLKSKVIESFISVACDSKAYKLVINNQKTFTYRDQFQQFALSNQDIATQMYKALLNNFKILNERAWLTTEHFLHMEKTCQTDETLSEDQKSDLRTRYEKEQVALEYCYENAAHFLWYFAIDESQYGENNIINTTIKEHKAETDVLLEVIATPIVASACPNMFRPFIEVTLQIIRMMDVQYETDFLSQIAGFLAQQLENLQLATGVKSFDMISDLQGSVKEDDKIQLAELCTDPEKLKLITYLRGEDQVSVTFGKIAFYCDFIKMTSSETKAELIKQDLFPTILTKLFKLQAMINRYHAQIYQRELQKDMLRLSQLKEQYGQELQGFDFSDFKPIPDPMNAIDELKNLYYQIEIQVTGSMADNMAKVSQKTVIELQLEENMSHTSNMCQLSIRKLIILILKANAGPKKKYHFAQAIDKKVIDFFSLMGCLIAEEFREFTDMSDIMEQISEDYIMKICCQHSAVLGEFNKVLFSSFSFGYMLVEFIKNKGLDFVEHLVRWINKVVDFYERKPENKRIDFCKHIQLLWSHIIDFYYSLTEGNYLDHQYQHFAIAFKPNPTEAVPENMASQVHEKMVKRLQAYMIDVLARCSKFLFVDLNNEPVMRNQKLNVFQYFNKYSELFFASYIEVYQFLCQGFKQCKTLASDSKYLVEASQKPKIQNTRNYQRLLDMGFSSEHIVTALEDARNNFDLAIELLFQRAEQSGSTEPKKVEEKEDMKVEEQPVGASSPVFQEQELVVEYEFKSILNIIDESFDNFLELNPMSMKTVDRHKSLENVFFKLGDKPDNKDVMHLLEQIRDKILDQIQKAEMNESILQLGILSHGFECLLKYQRSILLTPEHIFISLKSLNHLFSLLTKEFKTINSEQDFATNKELATLYIRIIDYVLSMFLYIAEESKISSDLSKVESILNNENTSAADNLQVLTDQLNVLSHLNESNIFYQHKEQTGKILASSTASIIDLFRSMHNMNPLFESANEYAAYIVIVRAIELLNFYHSIKGFGEFDFQQQFLKSEGLKALFAIRSYQLDSQQQTSSPLEKDVFKEIIAFSNKLLIQLCENESSRIKLYENLIKSVLFMQFQEKYKREEGHDVRSILMTDEMKQGVLKQSTISKKKKTQRSKSEERFMKDFDSGNLKDLAGSKKSKNKEVKSLLKKRDYSDTTLEDFIQFFNNVMQIQDLKSFLQACQNVCIIQKKMVSEQEKDILATNQKKSKTTDEPKEEAKQSSSKKKKEPVIKIVEEEKVSKEESKKHDDSQDKAPLKEEVFISLSIQSLKEMLLSVPQQYQIGVSDAENPKSGAVSKGHHQKFQTEIVYTLLDLVIEQLRDYHMLALQLSKSKQNPTIQGITISLNEKQQMVINPGDKLKQSRYLFDFVNILSHLSYITTNTPMLVQALLRHKDGKTYKFLIRNMYFLLTINSENVQLQEGQMDTGVRDKRLFIDDRKIDKRSLDLVKDFFKKLMLDNPHLTLSERKLKHEARQIFVKEVLKNLCETGTTTKYYQWPELRLIFNIGAIWLVSEILTEEEINEDKSEQKLDQLINTMKKYRTALRNIIIKQMIVESQQQVKGDQPQQFYLIKQLERINSEIVSKISFFENPKEQLYACQFALLNILRPFEDSKLLAIDGDRKTNLNESNLGFVNKQDQISEVSELEDEDEGDEEAEEESDESEESVMLSEDELLESNMSERNFQFSGDEVDDYGDELDSFSEISDYHDHPDNASEHMPQIQLLDQGYESIGEEDDYGLDIDMEDEEAEGDEIDNMVFVPGSNLGSNQDQESLGQAEGEQRGEEEQMDDEGDFSYYSESQGDRSQDDSYYDNISDEDYGDEDDQDNQVDIHVRPFRQLNNRDQQIQRQAQRDDLMSLHNLSVDQFNIFGRPEVGLPEDGNNAIIIPGNNFAQQIFNIHNQRRQQREQRGGNQDGNDVLGQIIGMINNLLGPRNQITRAQIKTVSKNSLKDQDKESFIHVPNIYLQGIATFIQKLATSKDLYKMFIKEKEEPKGQMNLHTVSLPVIQGEQLKRQSEGTTRSQFSIQNPFESQKNQGGDQFINLRPIPFTMGRSQSTMTNMQSAPSAPQLTANDARQIFADENQIDPEFLDNLDEEGLQNLADTENLINRFSNEGHQNRINSTVSLLQQITNPQRRQEIFRNLPEEVLNELPSNLFSEALIHRQLNRNESRVVLEQMSSDQSSDHNFDNRQSFPARVLNVTNLIHSLRAPGPIDQPPHRNRQGSYSRSRFMSVDSQFNPLGDFARMDHDPQWKQVEANVQVSDFSLKSNSLFTSVVQNIKDLITEMKTNSSHFDVRGGELDKICDQILSTNLLPQGDNIAMNYAKVSGIVQLVFSCIKIQSQQMIPKAKEMRLLKILLRVPTFRTGLIAHLLLLFTSGIHQLQDSIQGQLFNKNPKLIVGDQTFKVDIQMDKKLEIIDFVMLVLNTMRTIQRELIKVSTYGVLDFLHKPQDSPLVLTVLGALNPNNQIAVDKSLLVTFLEEVQIFDQIASEVPDIVYKQGQFKEQRNQWFSTLTYLVSLICRNIASSIKKQSSDKDQPKQVENVKPDRSLVYKIGTMLIKREIKQKDALSEVKRTFTSLASLPDCKETVVSFFKQSLSNSLAHFLTLLDTTKINIEDLKQEVLIATQILKIAKNIDKQESNICEDDLFFSVIKSVSRILDEKLNLHPQSAQGSQYIFKEEFRTIMTVIFILFEYNLKFIFVEEKKKTVESKSKNQESESPIKIEMQEASEIQAEIEAETGKKSKGKVELVDAIDEHLRNKIKDERIREDPRLKAFITFCLLHKKLINNFIRANQQLMNESIRNVVMKVPQILDFDNKRLMFRSQIKKIQKKYRLKYIDLEVRRDKVFDDSFEQLRNMPVDRWKGKLSVEFVNEQGIDEGGLSKEWFILLSQEIFNPDLALFVQSNAGSTYYPNPKSTVQPDHLQLFKFIGRIVGKSLYEQQLLDCYFVKAFYKIILGLPLNYHDIEDYDNEIYKNLKWILMNDAEGIGMNFTESQDFFGNIKETELIEGGKDIEVDNNNKFLYVQKMTYQKLYMAIKKQIDAFLQGFYDIIPFEQIQIFDNRELELLISGLPTIDIEDLRENTIYQNYTAESPVCKWLFELLEEFDNSDRAEFIQFVTGSSKVPVEGFKGLRGSRGIQKFQIVKLFTSDYNRLPMAHTCFKQLELPQYPSKQQLKDRLVTAIKEGKTFGIA